MDLERPRQSRGGNVWQHLRSFRKRLFDAIPDDALRLDGAYADLANVWAFMLPIVEMAENPVHIAEPLYLHEPSGTGKGGKRSDDRADRGKGTGLTVRSLRLETKTATGSRPAVSGSLRILKLPACTGSPV